MGCSEEEMAACMSHFDSTGAMIPCTDACKPASECKKEEKDCCKKKEEAPKACCKDKAENQ